MSNETKLLLALVGVWYFFLREEKPALQPRPRQKPPAGDGEPRPTTSDCVTKKRTGRTVDIVDDEEWAKARWRQTLEVVEDVVPKPLRGDRGPDIALSLVAQWAHESNRGANEYNFNFGGWVAQPGEPCFKSAGWCAGKDERKPDCKWVAWDTALSSIYDHGQRLIRRFPVAANSLVSDPTSDAWIRELGKGGYYTADVDEYASAYRAQRRWLQSVLAEELEQAKADT